jgi:NAD(P)-dependent dehydrogenase (short-subunit alcohol dehydrogenase family)
MPAKASTSDLHVEKLFSVKDYVCVVTGGGSGIGLMAAQALAANGAKVCLCHSILLAHVSNVSLKVYITSRRQEVLDTAAKSHSPNQGGQIIALSPCDVTKKDDLEKMYQELASKEKYINLLVAAAGISGEKATPDAEKATDMKKQLFDNETFEGWADTYNTDVTAVYFSTVVLLPLLQAGTESHGHLSASVIVISSMSGIMKDAQGHFSYNAAKGGTVHLTKLMSGEFQKLRSKCICTKCM